VIGYLATNLPLLEALGPAAHGRRRSAAPAAGRELPRLGELLEGAVVAAKGSLDRPVAGLATDFRRVVPGTAYFSLSRGADAARAIGEALGRGASAIVVDRLPLIPASGRTTFVQAGDVPAALAAAARRHFGFPDRAVTLLGVGGGRGKTSVAHVLHHLLAGDRRVGLLGSARYELGARTVPAPEGKPDALELHGLLAQMRDAGCRDAVLEAGTRAPRGGTIEGLPWSVAVFTNSTGPDGFDPEAVNAWRRIFAGEAARPLPVAVVNGDDEGGVRLAGELRSGGATRVVTFGFGPEVDVRVEMTRPGVVRLTWPDGTLEQAYPLPGREHAENLAAAAAAAWAAGRDLHVVLARLRAFPGVPGRLERIEAGRSLAVWIDAARTAAELRRALATVRGTTTGRVHVALSAGTDEKVLAAARMLADEVHAGADRRRVLATALAAARPGDAVLAAGRPDEMYQDIGDFRVPGDDRRLLRELLADRS
jgi:UDP-N-acetylmuramoyl-L-alanyl-D-glutamate--2,6-diaminopimelate ligase